MSRTDLRVAFREHPHSSSGSQQGDPGYEVVSKVGYSGCSSRSSQNRLELLGVVWANYQNFENIWENCSIYDELSSNFALKK
jgi:hypothetical protein